MVMSLIFKVILDALLEQDIIAST